MTNGDLFWKSMYPTLRLELAGIFGVLLYCSIFKKLHYCHSSSWTRRYRHRIAFIAIVVIMVYYLVDTIFHILIFALDGCGMISEAAKKLHTQYGDPIGKLQISCFIIF